MTERFDRKRVTVMGLGLFGGGAQAARYLAARGAAVTVTDLRTETELAESVELLEDLDIKWRLGGHDEEDFSSADLVVVNPAVKPPSVFVAAARTGGARITTEAQLVIELARERGCTVLGVTGTNGKSTTAAILGAIMAKQHRGALLGGNIGGSLLEGVESATPGTPVVMELSSFQLHRLDESGISPDVAAVTNLSPNHLGWHGSVDEYYRAKAGILRRQADGAAAVLNLDDPRSAPLFETARGRLYAFTTGDLRHHDTFAGPGAFVMEGYIALRTEHVCTSGINRGKLRALTICPVDALKLPGDHNLADALAAAAAAWAGGASREAISTGIADFSGLPDRMEKVAMAGGVIYINDSVATTPISTAASLKATRGRVVLIAGGHDKGLGFAPVAEAAGSVAAAVLTGDAADRLAAALAQGAPEVEVHRASGVAEAVRMAAKLAREGDSVLLSPGCSSYDEFRNYRDRARAFREAAGALPGAKPTGPE